MLFGRNSVSKGLRMSGLFARLRDTYVARGISLCEEALRSVCLCSSWDEALQLCVLRNDLHSEWSELVSCRHKQISDTESTCVVRLNCMLLCDTQRWKCCGEDTCPNLRFTKKKKKRRCFRQTDRYILLIVSYVTRGRKRVCIVTVRWWLPEGLPRLQVRQPHSNSHPTFKNADVRFSRRDVTPCSFIDKVCLKRKFIVFIIHDDMQFYIYIYIYIYIDSGLFNDAVSS
jgi:hypothetical protein